MSRSKDAGVIAERWATPVSHGISLWLQGILQSITNVHFFFTVDKMNHDVHVLTVGRSLPYRLIEEEYAYDCIPSYSILRETPHIDPKKHGHTWKFWKTPFIKELDEKYALSHYKTVNDVLVHDENIFEYFIITQNEWIEIVAPYGDEAKWEFLSNTTPRKAIGLYLQRDEWSE